MRKDSGYAMPNIKYLSWINLATNSADQIATVALPVLFVARFGGDAGDTSLLTIGATLPMLLFSLPMGALADGYSLRKVIFAGELVRFVSLIGLLILISLPSPPVLLLAAMAMLGATGTVAFQVAAPAMVAKSTTGEHRHKLNSTIELARSIAVTAGPPLSGILIGLAGGNIALVVACMLGLAALLSTSRLPSAPGNPTSPTNTRTMLREGVQFTLNNRWLRPILFVAMSFNMGWYALLGVVVAWASTTIGMTSTSIGVMFGCYGVGMIVGAMVLGRVRRRIPSTVLVQIGPWCGLAFASLIALSSRIQEPLVLMIAFFLIGCGPIIWTITTVGIRQAVTPPQMLGRVSATIMMASAGARPVGAGLGYICFQTTGYAGVFTLAFVLFGMQALMIGRTHLAVEDPVPAPALTPAK